MSKLTSDRHRNTNSWVWPNVWNSGIGPDHIETVKNTFGSHLRGCIFVSQNCGITPCFFYIRAVFCYSAQLSTPLMMVESMTE